MKKLINQKKSFLFVFLIFTSTQLLLGHTLGARGDSLITNLQNSLKLDHEEMILVKKILPECWKTDNEYNHLVRKNQADGEEVTDILIAIIKTKNGNLYQPLLSLYNEFIVYYQKECEPLLKDFNNLHACTIDDTYIDFIANQCQILSSFEFALTSLMFAREKFTGEQIYLFEKTQFLTWQKLGHAIQKGEDVNLVWKNWYSNSSVYHNAIKNGLTYNHIGKRVNHLAPFAVELEASLLQAIEIFQFKENPDFTKDSSYLNELSFLKRTIELLGLLNPVMSDKCEETFIASYENFISSGRVSWLYNSLGTIETSSILTRFFLDNIFDHSILKEVDSYRRDYLFRAMCHESRKESMKSILLERLKDKDGENRMLALYFLRIFPDNDVIEMCLQIYKSKESSVGERSRAESNLNGFIVAPNLSEPQKNRILQHLVITKQKH